MLRRPLTRPRTGRRGIPGRAALLFEVLAAYVPLRHELYSNDPRAMVTRARSARPLAATFDDEQAREEAVSLAWVVRRVLQVLPTENRCLIRSLVLVRLLERRGIDNRLVIGVRGSGFPAHAWVEHKGVPVLPRDEHEPLIEF